MVVIGVGVQPRTGLAAQAGIAVDDRRLADPDVLLEDLAITEKA